MNVEAELAVYYPLLRGDDPVAADAAEAALLPLLLPRAKRHVNRFLKTDEGRNYKYLKDDLVSHMTLKLVSELTRIRSGQVNPDPRKLAGYLSKIMTNEIKTFAREDDVVRIPARTRARVEHEEGKPLERSTSLETVNVEPGYASSEGAIDVWELILASCHTPLEHDVIKRKRTGHTAVEIAHLLRIHRTHVSRLIRRVEARVFETLAA